MRRLASVASPHTRLITQQARRTRIIQEIILCAGCPVLFCPLLLIIQGHRFNIVESMGCVMAEFLSWPSVIIRCIVPVSISILSLIYACKLARFYNDN